MKIKPFMITEESPQVDLTPLIDVVFILLIFFILSANFQKESSIVVDRPSASSSTVKEESKTLTVSVDSNKQIWFKDSVVNLTQLQFQMKSVVSKKKRKSIPLLTPIKAWILALWCKLLMPFVYQELVMLLSLPKSSKPQLFMVVGLSIAVNIILAYVLYLVISPSQSITTLSNTPVYTVRAVQPKEKPKPKKVELIVAANAPNSAPAKPTIVNFSIPEMDSAVALPEIVFSPDITLSINPTFEFDVMAIGLKNGSNIQSQVVFAKPTYQVPPKYPNKAKRNGIEGHVILELLVNEKGIPMQHRVIEEKPEGVFLRSSLRSVMRWKFVPPKTGQQWQQVTLNYNLEK